MRKLKKHMNQKLIAIAVLLLLAISVGYAALSTTLQINGTANIASNSWLVYFTNVDITTGSVTATTVPTTSGTSTTSLTWVVNLNTPGDFYEYYVDVKNDGTIDAMIGSLSNTSLTTNQAKYLNYSVTYKDGTTIEQYDKLISGETVTLKVRVEYKTDLNSEDLPSDSSTVTLTYTSNYVQADGNAKNRNTIASLNIGDTIDYTTTMNGVTLDHWRVFYTDENYTTLILADYLPNAAIDTTRTEFLNVENSWTYGINTLTNREGLQNAIQTKSNWKDLLTGTINGTNIDYSSSINPNIWAMGSPTLDLYLNSWNAKYPSDKIYIAQTTSVMGDGLNGYYIGTAENPTTTYVNYSSKEGYNDSLYYPHHEDINYCTGYWLSAFGAESIYDLISVSVYGNVQGGNCHAFGGSTAARPVISLPTSIVSYTVTSSPTTPTLPIGIVSDTYEIGDFVVINGEGFYVIEDSPVTKNTVKLVTANFVNTSTNKQDGNARAVVFDDFINTYDNSSIEEDVLSYVEALGIDVISSGLLSCSDMDSLAGYEFFKRESDEHGFISWWLDSPGCDDGYAWIGCSDGVDVFYDWAEIYRLYYYLRPYIEIQKSNITN